MTIIEQARADTCGKPAIARYVWPTMETIDVCEECSHRALRIAAAMGFRLGVLPLPNAALCTQRTTARRLGDEGK